MTRLRGLIGMGLAMVLVSALLAGTAPLGRVLMQSGLPSLAVPLLTDPAERGAAQFRAGSYRAAADAFATAEDPYNEGLAAAWAGDYARALASFDRVLAAHPSDREARANHALVAELFAGTELGAATLVTDPTARLGEETEAAPGQGGARAAGQGDEANAPKTGFWMPETTGAGLRRTPQMFDAQFIAADGRWLDTLEDQPGAYLRARLAAEQKAREKAGTALPSAEDPR